MANFQAGRRLLLRTELAVWVRARHMLDEWLVASDGDWVACLPMERVWHVLLGEPDVLPRNQALKHTTRCDLPPKKGICTLE